MICESYYSAKPPGEHSKKYVEGWGDGISDTDAAASNDDGTQGIFADEILNMRLFLFKANLIHSFFNSTRGQINVSTAFTDIVIKDIKKFNSFRR